MKITEIDMADLVGFLKKLTDSCIKDRSCLAPWITDTGMTGPDRVQLNTKDSTGFFFD